MSNVYKLKQDSNSVIDEASAWIAKLDRDLTESEKQVLVRWLRSDSQNAETLLELAQLWDKMGALSRLAEVFPHTSMDVAVRSKMRWTKAVSTLAVTCLVIALVLVAELVPTKQADDELIAQSARIYETAIGGLSKIELTDGSIITLNTNSRLKVDFNRSYRAIQLHRGEVHIDVAHDPSRPLTLTAGNRVFKAVGTAFTVRFLQPEQIELFVADGKVEVVTDLSYKTNALVDVIDQSSTSVVPQKLLVERGERLMLQPQGEKLEQLEGDELDVQLSWREGNLIFQGESLSDAIAEIGRYTSVEFVIMDENLASIRVAGLFKAGDVSGFLSSLQASFNISHQRADNGIILLTSPEP
jgi:transmembrane sensor